ncbi:MAG: hypothetical protein H6669_10145, partial [Ardenticatenaceae bacterium]|nr:hypothetical protein [Ardenticatenaceae bacterium]
MMHPDESDELESGERPENEPTRPGAKQPSPAEKPTLDEDEISLLDLMAGAEENVALPDEEETADLPLPPDDDASILTGTPEAEAPAGSEPLPLPLSHDEL